MENSFFHSSIIRQFILRFFIIFLAIETLLYYFPPLFYQEWLAKTIGNYFQLPVEGIFIWVNGVRFEISAFCVGLSTWAMWAGLVGGFSFPHNTEKIKYGLVGLIIILFFNFFRIAAIVFMGQFTGLPILETLHLLTWFAMSALVLGGWYFLLSKHARSAQSSKVARFLLEYREK